MMKLYQKSELTFAIACIVGYTVVAGNLRTLGDDSPAMAIGLIAIALVLLLFVRKNGLLEKYGLDRWAKNYMRRFVQFVHEECKEHEEQLRNLWIARWKRNFEEVESIQQQLMAIA
jgi:hypothetical protein